MIETAGDEILRMDNRGRVRVSTERRVALLEEFDRSGASAAAFSRMCGIKYQTFAGWVHRRRYPVGAKDGAGVEGLSVPVRFTEVMQVGPTAGEGIEVVLPSGARVAVGSQRQCELAAALLLCLSNRGGRTC